MKKYAFITIEDIKILSLYSDSTLKSFAAVLLLFYKNNTCLYLSYGLKVKPLYQALALNSEQANNRREDFCESAKILTQNTICADFINAQDAGDIYVY